MNLMYVDTQSTAYLRIQIVVWVNWEIRILKIWKEFRVNSKKFQS